MSEHESEQSEFPVVKIEATTAKAAMLAAIALNAMAAAAQSEPAKAVGPGELPEYLTTGQPESKPAKPGYDFTGELSPVVPETDHLGRERQAGFPVSVERRATVAAAVAAVPAVEGEKLVPKKPKTGSRRRKVLAVAATAATLASGLVVARWATDAGEPKDDTCISAERAPVVVGAIDGPFVNAKNGFRSFLSETFGYNDNREWSTAAAEISQKVGYYISPDRLAAANPTLVDMEAGTTVPLAEYENEKLKDTIGKPGEYCFELPAPIVYGQIETDGSLSLKEYAAKYAVPEDKIRELNVEVLRVYKSDEKLAPGIVIWLSDKVDTTLVLRYGSIQDVSEPAKQREIIDKNKGRMLEDGVTQEGVYYLPLTETDEMKVHSITPAQIIEAHKADFDLATRSEQTALDSRRSKFDEFYERGGSKAVLSAEQLALIESYGITEGQKQFIRDMVLIMEQMEGDFEAANVSREVTLAQFIKESGYGTSVLTQHNNFSGIKAKDDWKGDKVTITNPGGTNTPADFRKYPTREAGVLGHIDKLVKSSWYDDARRFYKDYKLYARGLQNKLAVDGSVEVPFELAWNGGNDKGGYEADLVALIERFRMVELFKLGNKVAAPSTPATAERRAAPGKPNVATLMMRHKYSAAQNVLWPADRGPQLDRLRTVQRHYEAMDVTPEGYEQFKDNLVDLRHHVPPQHAAIVDSWPESSKAAERKDNRGIKQRYSNFDGKRNNDGRGMGTLATNGRPQRLIAHFTQSNEGANQGTGALTAMQIQNGNRGIGVQFAITKKNGASTWWLTDDYTIHVKNANSTSWGCEIAAPDQEHVSPKQLEQFAYLAVHFLITEGYIKKGEPVTPVVNKRIRGHREMPGNDHGDFPTIAMAPMRAYIVYLLAQMGYTA